MTPTLIAASNRRFKATGVQTTLTIIYPTEGGEAMDGDTLQMEIEATAIRIIFPTESGEVQNGQTLQLEFE